MVRIGFVNIYWTNFPQFEAFLSIFLPPFFLCIVDYAVGSVYSSGLEVFLQFSCKKSEEIGAQRARKAPQRFRVNGLSLKDFIDVGAFVTYLFCYPCDGTPLVLYDLPDDGAHVYFFHGGVFFVRLSPLWPRLNDVVDGTIQ